MGAQLDFGFAREKIYFNEIDPFNAQWLRNQFGEVDERDISTIERPSVALRQHYFAGIGGWEWALRAAGWPAEREVWTGSCPCEPFSWAGQGRAHQDTRDLWAAFFHLITVARPAVIFGEQVTGALAYGWLDRACDDLERCGYAVGATVLPACSVGAPHRRARLYWVAVARAPSPLRLSAPPQAPVGDADGARQQGRGKRSFQRDDQLSAWASSDVVYCRDGYYRRVPSQSELRPLVDGGRFGNARVDRELSSRIGALKGAGSAVVIPLAAEFVAAVMELL